MSCRFILSILLLGCASGGKAGDTDVSGGVSGDGTSPSESAVTIADSGTPDTDSPDTDATETDATETDTAATGSTHTGDTGSGCLTPPTWYADRDGDGHGDPAVVVATCEPDTGFVSSGEDCDDGDATVYPGADEVCGDGRTNDCRASGPDCLRTGEQPAVGAYHARINGPEGANFGLRLADMGDLSGDGVHAFGVGTDAIAAEIGVEGGWLFSSPVGELGASEGYRVDGTGLNGGGLQFLDAADWDGDGQRDVIVGAVSADGSEGGAGGVVRLLSGPVTADVDLDGLPILVQGSGYVHGAGAAATILSDATGDGVPDLAVGAEWLGSGKVAFYVGPLEEPHSIITGDQVWYGSSDAPNGRWVWSADIDSDGLVDLLVGRPWGAVEDLGMAGTLEVYLSEVDWGPRSGPSDMSFSGGVLSAMVGTSVDVDGDFSGDGEADLLVGSNGALGELAHAYVLDLPTADHGRVDAVASGVIESTPIGGWESFQVTSVGDVDDDGRADLVCGVPWDGSASEGAAVLVYGPIEGVISLADRASHRWWLGAPETRLGRVVASAGDQDGDGQPDLLAVADVVGVDDTREVFLLASPGW